MVSALSAVLILIAFAIDIALWARVKNRAGILTGTKLTTTTAPGSSLPLLVIMVISSNDLWLILAFWMTFVSLVLSIVASGLIFVGYSKGGDGDSSYAMSSGSWFSKFRK
ncbi:hypothetical protein NLI96_g7887 [Meripilus lineatus]|uniref:Uncharacterized protein n=1 Tax=Meripilus lineatus TaxID=2056292 RepID=A0AAD5UYD5_9APHY|nr:hypothetical protein NLI96_g7887 [Physisporinus lineatus]